MGNEQGRQQETTAVVQEKKLTVYVINNREYGNELKAMIERMNAEHAHCLLSLSLLPGSEKCRTREYLHVVYAFQMLAKLDTNQIRSEIQLLSSLSKTFCRQLSETEIFCWFKLEDKRRTGKCDIQSTCKLDVDDIAFGTLENVTSFVTSSSPRSTTTAPTTYELEVQFRNRKIRLTQKSGEQLFRLETENKHMHRIIHVVKRANHFDVYFQLRQPPLLYECVNSNAREENRRFSRRSYLPGVTSEEIGGSDVLRVSFNANIHSKNLQELFFNLLVADSPLWELRFAWIWERITDVTAVDETEVSSFAVLYASKVLQTVGLRCQLINCSELMKGLPETVHAELLYYIAERYENESEHYLIDINKMKKQWQQPRKSNSKDFMKLRSVIFTPTRIIFRRPSDYESNRVFRDYFAGDRAQYVMKVLFRDEDVQDAVKNLNFIPLLSWNGALDDQVYIHYWTHTHIFVY